MSIVVKDTRKYEHSTPAEGQHDAVCIDIVDLGVVRSAWGEANKVEARWALSEVDPKSGMRFIVSRRFTPSLHEKSALRPFLEKWRGKKFDAKELEGFDLEKLIGVGCQLFITHNPGEDGTVWANVVGAIPPAKGSAKLAVPADYVRVKDREPRLAEGKPEITDEDIPF